MVNKNSKIYIAGHKGMVGSSCRRILLENGYNNLIYVDSKKLDLRDQIQVKNFFKKYKPNVVINAAARVGGIHANSIYPYQFLLDNLQIQNNLIQNSFENNVEKFIFLGSSCIYPKFSKQPIKEEYLLSGELEPTNQWYALAKISGLKLIEALNIQYNLDYVSLMPTNLYGPNDNFDLDTSHVLPAMIRKFHEAKIKNQDVHLWGSGTPRREFLYVDDLALAVLFFLNKKNKNQIYNIGFGNDITINELALKIQNLIGHNGKILWDRTKPDGTPRKLISSDKAIKEGWTPKVSLDKGIQKTYEWFLNNYFK